MRSLRFILTFLVAGALILGSLTNISSCTKHTIHDTTIVRDTTVVTVRDTVYDLTNGLVAYYNFNGGTLKDSSGWGNNINFSNATLTVDRFGRANNAYLFDGSTSYMTVPNSTSLNPSSGATFMAIIKINSFYAGHCLANQIFGKGSTSDSQNGFYCLRFTDWVTGCSGGAPSQAGEHFNAGISPDYLGAGVIAYDAPVNLGQWTTLIYTYDNVISKMYINGVLVDSNAHSNSMIPNTDPLFIGRHGNPALNYSFSGVIDELRIYNRPMTIKEVAQLNKVQE